MNAVSMEPRARETRKERLALARWAGMGSVSGLGVTAGKLVAYAAFAVLVGVTTAIVQALGIDVDLTDQEWRQNDVGTVAGIAALVGMFVGSLLGGERWHVTLARSALDAQARDVAGRSGSDPGNDRVHELGTRVEERTS